MPTSYHCLNLQLLSETSDLDTARLYENGCLGLIEEEMTGKGVRFKAYFPDDRSVEDRVAQLKEKLSGLVSVTGTIISLSANDFKQASFDPFLLTPNLWVVPPPDLSGDVDIRHENGLVIRPGMAFGTGRHETTQLVAEVIEQLPVDIESLLDVGTGSGILALLAKRCGIRRVTAVEVSEDARNNAQGNFALNHVGDIQLFDSLEQIKDQYDVVVANILTPTILNLKPHFLRVLRPKGRLILSGITSDESKTIEQAFSEMTLSQKTDKNGWLCFVFITEGQRSPNRSVS